MVTPNLQLNQPAAGSLNWDVPLNANFGLVDSALGAVANVALTNLNVTLSAAQYQCGLINFTGTLTGNVIITFPAFGRIYWLQNSCAAATSFTITCKTAASTRFVALPPSESIAVMCDGTDMKFIGLGRVGTYWDFAGSAVPNWVTACTPAPYLNCDGTAFSSATYPALRDYLGVATLPDTRGRFRASLNQGTGRLTGDLDGNTFLDGGGSQTIAQANLPNYTLPNTLGAAVTDPTHAHNFAKAVFGGAGVFGFLVGGGTVGIDYVDQLTDFRATSISVAVTGSVTSGGSGTSYAPPGYIGGLTLIRAG